MISCCLLPLLQSCLHHQPSKAPQSQRHHNNNNSQILTPSAVANVGGHACSVFCIVLYDDHGKSLTTIKANCQEKRNTFWLRTLPSAQSLETECASVRLMHQPFILNQSGTNRMKKQVIWFGLLLDVLWNVPETSS
mmetsp:Transcript_34175/g.78809  ORF Transcript_34175/g.78809 Transcript_34175/m.78809 type:complete len:136 (+) Transcript_34175:345-752(+)